MQWRDPASGFRACALTMLRFQRVEAKELTYVSLVTLRQT